MTTKILALVSSALILTACNSGYNDYYDISTDSTEDALDIPCGDDEDVVAISTNANSTTNALLDLLADYSCEEKSGVLSGQSLGHANEVADGSDLEHYDKFITQLHATTANKPAIISVELEGQAILSADDRSDGNTTLKEHWDEGGLIEISWKPLNPWTNDRADISGTPGTESDLSYTDTVDIDSLITGDKADLWDEMLDEVGTVIDDLAAEGISVLFRPLPKMNTDDYWWGSESEDSTVEHSGYIKLWKDLVAHFNSRQTSNILWVFSPADEARKASDWAYPGENYVDVVGVIEESNNLVLTSYETLSALKHPYGISRFSPTDDDGTFDANDFATVLLDDDNTNVAFWISDYSRTIDNEESQRAIINLENGGNLMNNTRVISTERLESAGYNIN